MMTTLMMCWCLLSMDVFLWSFAPTVAEVVQSMSACTGFILDEIPPNIPDVLEDGIIQNPNRYKVICQTYENTRRFVTLYDTENRIPVFSAGKFNGTDGGKRPPTTWNIEPGLLQLQEYMSNMWDDVDFRNLASNDDYINNQIFTFQARNKGDINNQVFNFQTRNMFDIKNQVFKYMTSNTDYNKNQVFVHMTSNTDYVNNQVFKYQARNADYINNLGYNRGHLFPCCYGYNDNEKISTFTLTNIVPQHKTFNGGSWSKMESCVKCVMETYCKDNNNVPEAFVVTGAKSGQENLNNRVNIPSVLWSAFCCYSTDKGKWLASAYWGSNTKTESKYLETKTLEELQQQLGIEAFSNNENCPQHETVTDPKKHCQCPPPPPTTPAPTTPAPTTTTTATTSAATSKYSSELLRYICTNRRGMDRNLQRRERSKLWAECRKIQNDLLPRRIIEIPSHHVLAKISREHSG